MKNKLFSSLCPSVSAEPQGAPPSRDNRKALRIAVVGAGVRGGHLAKMLGKMPYPTEITAVCDLVAERCAAVAPDARHFRSWKDLFAHATLFDAVIIATLDSCHAGPLLAAMDCGVHILVEKPIVDNLADAERILAALARSKSQIAVCHTLRFLPAYRQLKSMIPRIGPILHVDHEEAIGNIRFAHNYVRGQWGNASRNTLLFIHKCCHDVDYILSLLPDYSRYEVTSIGALSYFNRDHAPTGSTERCHDCPFRRSCRFSAVLLYDEADKTRWPASMAGDTATTLYGRCVFRCPNDVVDHQTAQLLIDGRTTFSIAMTGFSGENGRRIRIQGTDGELSFDEPARIIRHWDFASKQVSDYPFEEREGYHPEDADIVKEWLEHILLPSAPPVSVNALEAVRTLRVVLDIEKARLSGKIIHYG